MEGRASTYLNMESFYFFIVKLVISEIYSQWQTEVKIAEDPTVV